MATVRKSSKYSRSVKYFFLGCKWLFGDLVNIVLHDALEGSKEESGIRSIDVSVVASQSDSHQSCLLHSHDGLGVRDNRVLCRSDGQNTSLSYREQRTELCDSEHSHVGDGECSGGVFSRGEGSSLGLSDQLLPVFGDLLHRSFVGVLEGRGNETSVNGNSHSNVDIGFVQETTSILVRVGTVDDRVLFDRHGASLGQHGRYRNTVCLDLFVHGLERSHFDISADLEGRNGQSGNHVSTDRLLHTCERNETIRQFNSSFTRWSLLAFSLLVSSGHLNIINSNTSELSGSYNSGKIDLGLFGSGSCHGGGSNDASSRSPNWLGRSGCSGLGTSGSTFRSILDIGGGDSSLWTGSGNGAKVKANFFGLLLSQRRSNNAGARATSNRSGSGCLGCGGSWSSSGRSGGGGSWRSGTGQRSGISLEGRDITLVGGNQSDRGTNSAGITFIGDDGSQESVLKCFNIHIGLVTFDNHDGFTGFDGVTFGLEPRDDLTLLHGGRKSRHIDLAELAIGSTCGRSFGFSCGGGFGGDSWCRSGTVSNFFDFIFGSGDQGNCVSDGGHLSFVNKDLCQVTILECFDIHIGLVGFDNHDGFTGFNLITLVFQPCNNLTLLHGRRKGRHENLGSGIKSRTRSSGDHRRIGL
mmetsp:Transcript_9923/g.24743  ORF Transcript_9923/g.24743 Transcript_9923/m.24743 type:complete len:638 (-) Transcript_9923:192-2105(-)